MKFKLVYTRRAVKDIEKLDKQICKRIKESLERYSQDPLTHADFLTDSRIGSYRFRIGNYRVIFDIKEDQIIILRVGHRGRIYRNI